MSDLYQRSIDIILQNQAESGAYIASPTFEQYAYCWLRDGSFIAYAMDCAGHYASARAFFMWVHKTIQRYAWKIERVLQSPSGELKENDYLHTRYTLAGDEVTSPWTNFQLDGYGAWLWALAEHVARSGDTELRDLVAPSVTLTVRYLSALWMRPNYDYWEEFRDKIHVSTLATIYGGLCAAQALRLSAGRNPGPGIRQFTLERGVHEGHLVKYVGTDMVDASLIAAGTPFGLVAPDDPVMLATVDKIERDLVHGGGTHRYALDTYYGGGEWILLSAWLGWYYSQRGEWSRAEHYRAWVERQADDKGELPEQVSAHLLFPNRLAEWQTRWGPIAKPLLWSHAMYLILSNSLDDSQRGERP